MGKFPPKKSLPKVLKLLGDNNFNVSDLQSNEYHRETIPSPLLSFCESAAHHGLSTETIIHILDENTPDSANHLFSYDIGDRRRVFFQAVALKSALQGNFLPETKEFLSITKEKKSTYQETEKNELSQTVETLLPWYALRAHLICGISPPEGVSHETLPKANRDYWGNGYSHSYQMLPYDISRAYAEVITLCGESAPELFSKFQSQVLQHKGKYFRLHDAINFLRAAFRCEHLHSIREILEQDCVIYQNSVSKSIDETDPESDAQDLINIAKAVLPVSPADANAYFDQAVELVSRFGDEIIERWTTTQNIADHASLSQKPTFLICERFFRCAEVVSESVAREKHWDRCETFAIGTKLHCTSAFATWSRWRDRRLLSYRPTLLTIAKTSLKNRFLSASAAWSLTGFEECNANGEFHALCIQQQTDKELSEIMAAQAIKDLELADASFSEFQALAKATSADYGHRNIEEVNKAPFPEVKSEWQIETNAAKQAYIKELEQYLASSFPENVTQLNATLNQLKTDLPSYYREVLFETLISSTPLGRESSVLEMILHSDRLDFSSLYHIISLIRKKWQQKASIKKVWPTFIKQLAKRFPDRFVNAFHWGWSFSGLKFNETEVEWIHIAISESLSENPHPHEASTFFAFVSHVITAVSHDEALDILEYALSRFEIHIPEDFGESLVATEPDSLSPLSGLLWSTLGSPSSAERWQAAHCIVRLASLGCQEEIDQLILRLQTEEVGLYGSQKQTFFLLHSKLYLLIALERAATEFPSIVTDHAALLAEIALEGTPHFLIQKTAASICIKIAKHAPNAYSETTVAQLRKVGISQLQPCRRKSTGEFINFPWHKDGELKNDEQPSFDNDFGWYWFPQLREIFGVHQNQIEDLARDFAFREIGLTFDGKFNLPSDGREYRHYDSSSRRSSSSHSHGSYPYTDRFSFYYSYHSFLHAGALLLSKTPVTSNPDYGYETDRWKDWVSRHALTRSDGFWLSDRRDPTPLLRRKWTGDPISDTWHYEIQSDDFYDALITQCPDADSMFVSGSWCDIQNEHIEDIQIRSALVTSQTAEALARFLRSRRSPYDFGLPGYHSEDDFETHPFEMLNWITIGGENDLKLDKFDPYSGEITYPPRKIQDHFAKLLNLTPDREHRYWNTPDSESPCAFTEIWDDQGDELHQRYRNGHRMQMKKNLLLELCKKTEKDLLFCVQIGRSTAYSRYRSRTEEDISLIPSFKIFILSHDGILRDSNQHHSIR